MRRAVDQLTRLAHSARAGDRRALQAFIDASYPEVWRLCQALVGDAADDLAQETFVRVLHALKRFRGDSSARIWTLAIARRACMDELRNRHRRLRRDDRLVQSAAREGTTFADPSGNLVAHELLSLLAPDRRAAFVLTQLFRLSYEEAASVCDCPPGTIRSRVARARDDLIAALNEAPTAEHRTDTR